MVISQQKRGVPIVIAIFLALLLVTLTVAAGFLWLREADARLQAEQQITTTQKKYDDLKSQCDAMKNSGIAQGVALSAGEQQEPIIAALAEQAELPQCERAAIQPFAETMRAQDTAFFAGSKDGDVLVTYPLSKRVFIFRESSSQLINQARIADAPQPQQQPTQRSPSIIGQ